MVKQSSFTHRRWLMLVLYALINLSVGSIYSWSVFALPLQAQLQTENLTFSYTVAVCCANSVPVKSWSFQD